MGKKFNLEDISVMIASLLTIYEKGIYMPYKRFLDNKYVIIITEKDKINKIKELKDTTRFEDCFIVYISDNSNKDNDIIYNHNYSVFKNYQYINDFISYINNNDNKYVTMSNLICNFLDLNYDKSKRRIKL